LEFLGGATTGRPSVISGGFSRRRYRDDSAAQR